MCARHIRLLLAFFRECLLRLRSPSKLPEKYSYSGGFGSFAIRLQSKHDSVVCAFKFLIRKSIMPKHFHQLFSYKFCRFDDFKAVPTEKRNTLPKFRPRIFHASKRKNETESIQINRVRGEIKRFNEHTHTLITEWSDLNSLHHHTNKRGRKNSYWNEKFIDFIYRALRSFFVLWRPAPSLPITSSHFLSLCLFLSLSLLQFFSICPDFDFIQQHIAHASLHLPVINYSTHFFYAIGMHMCSCFLLSLWLILANW